MRVTLRRGRTAPTPRREALEERAGIRPPPESGLKERLRSLVVVETKSHANQDSKAVCKAPDEVFHRERPPVSNELPTCVGKIYLNE